MYEDIARIAIEAVSAIICVILVRFMIKPYQLTREARYLGLPLGFGLLGLSYIFTIFFNSPQFYFNFVLIWLVHLTRTFAFIFLAATYYFSKPPSKNSRRLWDLTLGLLIVALIIISLLLIVKPELVPANYRTAQVYLRISSIILLTYMAIHTLRSHIEKPDPTTIWIPLGFILLAISQYSLIFYYTDLSKAANWGGIILRLLGLIVFLVVAYRTFYSSKETGNK